MKELKTKIANTIDLGFGKIYIDQEAWEHLINADTYFKYKNGKRDKVVHKFEFERQLTNEEKITFPYE
jgi:hypothetical protein